MKLSYTSQAIGLCAPSKYRNKIIKGKPRKKKKNHQEKRSINKRMHYTKSKACVKLPRGLPKRPTNPSMLETKLPHM
jgi:hypothetical protein